MILKLIDRLADALVPWLEWYLLPSMRSRLRLCAKLSTVFICGLFLTLVTEVTPQENRTAIEELQEHVERVLPIVAAQQTHLMYRDIALGGIFLLVAWMLRRIAQNTAETAFLTGKLTSMSTGEDSHYYQQLGRLEKKIDRLSQSG